jgi:hypothetical protein
VPNRTRTIGEERFEEYLEGMGYPFEYEQEYPGKAKRPDYTVTKDGVFLFDVKDFDPNMPAGFQQFNPYIHIRKRIEAGRKKFKEYKEFPCGVVLQNNGNVFASTETPSTVLGAMYGDVGFSIPIYVGGGVAPESPPPIQQGFMGGAQMLANKNTTISALVTLRYVAVGRLRIRKIWQEQPELSTEDVLAVAQERFGKDYDFNEKQQGVIVWENIHARIPLSRALFTGPFDSRFGLDGSDIANVFYGSQLAELPD